MKIKFHILTLLLLIYTCDRQLTAPVRDNPFDSASGLTDPFNLQTKNFSDHIQVSWEYSHEKPVIDSYLLYRINGSGVDTLYKGIEKTFEDTTVVWDSTYSYYVTGIINEKETSPPEIGDIPEVVRRIYVGGDGDYTRIGDAINSLNDGDVIYVKDWTYQENIDFNGKKISLICEGESSCIIDGNGETVVTFRGDLDSTAVLDGFTITGGNNNDDYDGGGMTIRTGSDPLIQNCTFTNNSADRGAAVFVRGGAKPSFIGCSFATNTSTEDGGAIFCARDSKPKIENCTFTGNISTDGNGGAIAIDEASPTITSCIFNSNHASGGLGGALSFNNLHNVTINLSDFISNEAGKAGSVYLNKCNGIQFTQCRFTSNIGTQGGGFYINQSGQLQPINIDNCILWQQSSGSGGAIYSDESSFEINHCTVIGNKAEGLGQQSKGGGIYFWNESSIKITNSILWQNIGDYMPLNDPENNKSDIFDGGYGSSAAVTYTNIDDWSGVGNITIEDPLFTDPDNGNFTLQPSSPCKDAGDPDSASDTDGTRADMGAHGGSLGDWE